MADWITCNVCGLKHTARADGTCPRCKSQVGAGAGTFLPEASAAAAPGQPPLPAPPQPSLQAPQVLAQAPPRAPTTSSIPLPTMEAQEEPFPLGARIAGGVLYANVLLTLVTMIATGTTVAQQKFGFGAIASIVIDVIVGALLVAGRDKSRGIALVRVVLGALVFTPVLWSSGGPLLGLMQLCFSGSLLLLLVGRAAPVRMGGGLTLATAVLVLSLTTVTSPRVAGAARGLAADLVDRGNHVEEVEGTRAPWRLSLPAGHWHEHAPEKESGAERAFVWPEVDGAAYVNVVPLRSGTQVNLDAAVDGILEAVNGRTSSFEEHERRTFATARGDAVVVRATMVEAGTTVHGWMAVHASAGELGTVFALASQASPEVLDELLEVASALELGAPAAERNAGANEGAEGDAESEVQAEPAEGEVEGEAAEGEAAPPAEL